MQDNKDAIIPLMFPNLELGYSYPQSDRALREHNARLRLYFDRQEFTPRAEEGCLLPHFWVKDEASVRVGSRELHFRF